MAQFGFCAKNYFENYSQLCNNRTSQTCAITLELNWMSKILLTQEATAVAALFKMFNYFLYRPRRAACGVKTSFISFIIFSIIHYITLFYSLSISISFCYISVCSDAMEAYIHVLTSMGHSYRLFRTNLGQHNHTNRNTHFHDSNDETQHRIGKIGHKKSLE